MPQPRFFLFERKKAHPSLQEAFRTGKVAPAAKVTRISRKNIEVPEGNREPLDGRHSGEHYNIFKDRRALSDNIEYHSSI